MATLSSAIVQQQLASVQEVEAALARQVLHGGDLTTNLLEAATIDEARLTPVLAESHGLPAAPSGPLPVPPETLRRLIPPELAKRHGVHPLYEREGGLCVAVSEPLPEEVLQDLGFSLGLDIHQFIAPSVRIRQALSRDYQLPLDDRTRRVLAKLDSSEPAATASTLNTALFADLPRPPSGSATGDTRSVAAPALEALGDEATPHMPPIAEDLALAQRTAPPPKVEQRGANQNANRGPSHPARAQRATLQSIENPSPQRSRRLGPYTAAMSERDLMAATTRDDILRAFFDFAAQYFEYAALFSVQGDLVEGLDAAGAGPGQARVRSIGVPLDLPSIFSKTQRAGQLQLLRMTSQGLDASLRQDLERRGGQQALVLPILLRGRCVLMFYGDHGERDIDLSTVGDVISFSSLVSTALERLILRKKMATRGQPRSASLQPTSGSASNNASPSPPTPPLPEAPAPTDWSTEKPSPAIPDQSDDEAPIPLTRSARSQPKLELVDEQDATGPETSHAAPSSDARQESFSARPPRASHQDTSDGLPSVVVNPKEDAAVLLKRLLAGDRDAVEALGSMGAPAAEVLAAHLPGPITAELRQGSYDAPAAASSCGPILRALARVGPEAAPAVLSRIEDPDLTVQAWATRLLGELPCHESARAVAARVTSQQMQVRRAALAAGRMFQKDPGARKTLMEAIVQQVQDATLDEEKRVMAIEALEDVRNGAAVPHLAALLEGQPEALEKAAVHALLVLTRQDFGPDRSAWMNWYENNRHRHRIEWLIDALDHDSQDIRRAAGDELKHWTKEYFGYYDDLPQHERQQAQARYRQWWETTGRARFP